MDDGGVINRAALNRLANVARENLMDNNLKLKGGAYSQLDPKNPYHLRKMIQESFTLMQLEEQGMMGEFMRQTWLEKKMEEQQIENRREALKSIGVSDPS